MVSSHRSNINIEGKALLPPYGKSRLGFEPVSAHRDEWSYTILNGQELGICYHVASRTARLTVIHRDHSSPKTASFPSDRSCWVSPGRVLSQPHLETVGQLHPGNWLR